MAKFITVHTEDGRCHIINIDAIISVDSTGSHSAKIKAHGPFQYAVKQTLKEIVDMINYAQQKPEQVTPVSSSPKATIKRAQKVITPSRGDLLTTQEVANQLAVSRSQIYVLVREGKLTPIKIGRCTKFRAKDVADYIDNLFPKESN